jgi:benzil reductase ((S)-benzoin forming)
MKKNLIIITGTTRGLGKEFESILLMNSTNYLLTLNRHFIKSKNKNIKNIKIDLSSINKEDINLFKQEIISYLSNHKFERIIFINNAFTIHPISKIVNLNNNSILASFHTNIFSQIILLKEFIILINSLSINKLILNISSGASKYAIEDWSVYSVSKSAIEMFLLCIKKEHNDVDVYSIDPGVLDTTMQIEIRKYYEGSENYFTKLKKNNLLKDPNIVASNILKDIDL